MQSPGHFGRTNYLQKLPTNSNSTEDLPILSSPEQFSVLRHRPVRLLWISRVASRVAFQMLGVAIGWQMYALTSNPLDLGLIGLCQFVPAALLSLVAGQAVDRYDRSLVLRLAQIVEAVAALILLVTTVTGLASREWIFAAAFILGSARAFEGTAFQTVLPAIVVQKHLTRAIAALASAQQIATIGGPALGGLLYLVGPTFVYSLCGVLFLSGSACMAFVRAGRIASTREPLTTRSLFAGFGYIRRNPIILGAITLDLLAVLLGGALALLPAFARDVYGIGPGGMGLLRAAPAAGALGISIALARAPLLGGVGRIMFACVAVYGVTTIMFALSSSFYLSMAVLAVLGAADMVSVVIRQTLIQVETPDDMRGRVSAVNLLFTGTSNQLGEFRAGAMATLFGTTASVLIGGCCTLVVVVVGMRLFPALLRVNRLHKD
jgi:MFS family permease